MIPGGLKGRDFIPSRLNEGFRLDKLPSASEQKVRGLPVQKVVVTMERRWMVQRQAKRGQTAIGEAHSSQGMGDA